MIKPGLDLDPLWIFFFLNPYPTLFLIGLGKTQPIKVGLGRVLAGQAEIAIPNVEGRWLNAKLNEKELEGKSIL